MIKNFFFSIFLVLFLSSCFGGNTNQKVIFPGLENNTGVLLDDSINQTDLKQESLDAIKDTRLSRDIELTQKQIDDYISKHGFDVAIQKQQVFLYMEMQDYEKALELLKIIKNDDPNDINVLLNLSKVSLRLGDIETADLYYKEALKIDPQDESVLSFENIEESSQGTPSQLPAGVGNKINEKLNDIVDLIQKKKYKEAVLISEALLKDYPDNIQLHKYLGLAHMSILDFEKSIEMYEKSIQLGASEDFDLLYNIAIASRNLNNDEKARKYIDLMSNMELSVENKEKLDILLKEFVFEFGETQEVKVFLLDSSEEWNYKLEEKFLISLDRLFLEGNYSEFQERTDLYMEKYSNTPAAENFLNNTAPGRWYSGNIINEEEDYKTSCDMIKRELIDGELNLPIENIRDLYLENNLPTGSIMYEMLQGLEISESDKEIVENFLALECKILKINY